MTPAESVAELRSKWRDYKAALKAVIDGGVVEQVVDELTKDPWCPPLIEALGRMMSKPGAERGIPILLDLIVRMAPEIKEARDALVFAGINLGPYLSRCLENAARENDEFSLRELA